jgi:1-acyl-sn-glycerol-3-phosphate acyltransferase
MATKGVLGNDPFQRGAAQRPAEPKAEPKKEKASKGKAAKKAASSKASTKSLKAAKAPKSRKPGRATGATEEEAQRLREPAAPETPRRRPPARVPVIGGSPDSTQPQTPKEQEVDRVLATAAAVEAAEAAAEAAAEVAVETLLAFQAQQSGIAAAPRGSLEETWNRELATAVVAEAAEAAAEAVLDAALSAGSSSAAKEAALSMDEERTIISAAFQEDEDPSSTFSAEVTVIDKAYSESVEETEGVDAAATELEAEQELPDTTRDEFPPQRGALLSEVPLPEVPPPSVDREPPQEPFFTEQAQGQPEASSERAGGMFSLAKEIAVQALASASVGKALGTAQGVLSALGAGLGLGGSTALDEYGRDAELVSELQPLLDFLYERYWRVSVQGADQIPMGGAILVANHSGALPYDGLVTSLALLRERPDLREPRWLVEDQVFHAPVLGTLFNRLGAVRACPENAVRLLDEQRPVLVFPEGYQGMSKPFAQRYQLKRFGRGGFVKLALRTGAPIIPVAIVGSEETSPLLGRIPAGFLGVPYVPLTSPMPLPARWTLRFGEPISMEGLGPDAAEELAEVQRLTERTREAIMGMLQALLRERRSVFAG